MSILDAWAPREDRGGRAAFLLYAGCWSPPEDDDPNDHWTPAATAAVLAHIVAQADERPLVDDALHAAKRCLADGRSCDDYDFARAVVVLSAVKRKLGMT